MVFWSRLTDFLLRLIVFFIFCLLMIGEVEVPVWIEARPLVKLLIKLLRSSISSHRVHAYSYLAMLNSVHVPRHMERIYHSTSSRKTLPLHTETTIVWLGTGRHRIAIHIILLMIGSLLIRILILVWDCIGICTHPTIPSILYRLFSLSRIKDKHSLRGFL